MDRRRFVTAAALGAGATLAACGPGPGHGRRNTGEVAEVDAPGIVTRPRIRWRLASSFPRSTEILYRAAEHLAARVGALTDGRFEIVPSEAGALVPPLQVLDAQEPHLSALLGFVGITDVTYVRAEKLAFSPEDREASIANAQNEVHAVASKVAAA